MREKPTWPSARIRKKGEGMPNYENNNLFGTLYITFDVEFPKTEFTAEEKECECGWDVSCCQGGRRILFLLEGGNNDYRKGCSLS